MPVLFYAGGLQGALLRESLDPPPERFITLGKGNAGWVLTAPGMPALAAASNALRGSLASHIVGVPAYALREDTDYFLRVWGPYSNMERGLIPVDAVALVNAAGVIPYYLPDLTFVDYHGLNDRVIARNPVAVPNNERRLAHDRKPPPGYLEERGVNFDVHPVARDLWSALRRGSYALQFAPGLWMPFDAPSLEWVGARFDSFVTADDMRAFAIDHGHLVANSKFDVYAAPASDSPISGGRRTLVYVREPCDEDDVRARFFLHLNPVDENDLPEERRKFGFDNLNFHFAHWGSRRDGRCIAVRPLPDYPIDSVATGQFTERGEVWIAEFALDGGQ